MNWPDPPTPPAVLDRLSAFVEARPSFAVTCRGFAAVFRVVAQEAYDDGDQARGDYATARGLAWDLAARTGNLDEVRL